MIVWIIIICGFVYGREYFIFSKPYGTADSSVKMGVYILSVQWWNVKFNWYTILDDWYICLTIKIPVNILERKYREYSIRFSSTGITTCAVNTE
jgi:hypothetical protein